MPCVSHSTCITSFNSETSHVKYNNVQMKNLWYRAVQ